MLWLRGHSLLYYINGADALPRTLTPQEEAQLLEQLATNPKEARDRLVVHNLRLVVYIARKFESAGVGMEDLISIGTIGLIKAVNTFCPDRKIKLATYASRCIENEILMHLRKISGLRNECSIDEPLNLDWDGNELLLSDVLGTEEDTIGREFDEAVELHLLRQAVNTLDARDKEIMLLRFGLGGRPEQTQKEVADRIGISQSYISRLEKRIIKRLRHQLQEAGIA